MHQFFSRLGGYKNAIHWKKEVLKSSLYESLNTKIPIC